MAEPVIVVPYDPDWPRRFDEESAVLGAAFAGCHATIEHIGSTAVPGLGAKPVIDIMVGLRQLEDAEARISGLEGAGYEYVPQYETELPHRRYFRKPPVGRRTVHLHCIVKDSNFWVRHLAFRDYLRAHPETAAAYHALKCSLAARVSKADYTDAKSPFIEGVIAAALGGDGHHITQPPVASNPA